MRGSITRARGGVLSSLSVIAVALVVGACGSSSGSSSSSSTAASAAASSSSGSASSSAAASGTATGSPFNILMVIDTSGPTKAIGTVDEAAEKASAAYWNANGGILGHPIKITVLNDNGDETTAVSVFENYLTGHPKPDLVFGGTSGIDSGGLIPAVKRAHLLDVAVDDGGAACGSNAQVTCPTAFTPGPKSNLQQAPVVAWFVAHHFKKVGILQEEDAFSQSETPLVQAGLKAAGVQTYVASFAPTAVDVKPQLSQLQSDGAQAIYAEALGAPAGYEAADRAQLGLVSKIPLVFDYGAASLDLTKLATPAQLQNAYEGISKSSDPYVTMPGRTQLIKYGGSGVDSQPIIIASFEWQDLVTVHDAAEQAKSISTDALVNALNSLSPSAQNDPLNMTAQGVQFTPSVHENMSPAANNAYEVVPVGPIKTGMVYYKK
jgi:ABC-type branched-subunit amino acid transport system substrate-binding protein